MTTLLVDLFDNMTNLIAAKREEIRLLTEIQRCIWVKRVLDDDDMTTNVSIGIKPNGDLSLKSGDWKQVFHYTEFPIEELRLVLSVNQKQQLVESVQYTEHGSGRSNIRKARELKNELF